MRLKVHLLLPYQSSLVNIDWTGAVCKVRSTGLGEHNGGGGCIRLEQSSSGGSALEKALLAAKRLFNRDNTSCEALAESDGEVIVSWKSFWWVKDPLLLLVQHFSIRQRKSSRRS